MQAEEEDRRTDKPKTVYQECTRPNNPIEAKTDIAVSKQSRQQKTNLPRTQPKSTKSQRQANDPR